MPHSIPAHGAQGVLVLVVRAVQGSLRPAQMPSHAALGRVCLCTHMLHVCVRVWSFDGGDGMNCCVCEGVHGACFFSVGPLCVLCASLCPAEDYVGGFMTPARVQGLSRVLSCAGKRGDPCSELFWRTSSGPFGSYQGCLWRLASIAILVFCSGVLPQCSCHSNALGACTIVHCSCHTIARGLCSFLQSPAPR